MLDTVEVFHGVFIYFAKQRGFTRGVLNGDGDLGVNARGCFNGFNFNGVLVFRRAVGQGMHRGVLQVVERVLNAEQPRQDDDFDKRRKNPRYVDDAGENPSAYDPESRNPTDTTLSTVKWAGMQDNPEWMRIMQAPYRAREWVGNPESFGNLYEMIYPDAAVLNRRTSQSDTCFSASARHEISDIRTRLSDLRWRQNSHTIYGSDYTHVFLVDFQNYTVFITPGKYAFCQVHITVPSFEEVDDFCCGDSRELYVMLSICRSVAGDFPRKIREIARSPVNAQLQAAGAIVKEAFKPGMYCIVRIGPSRDDNSIHMYFSSIDDLTDNFQARYTEADTTQRQAREARLHPDTARLQGFPPLPARPPPARGRGRGRGR